jgi:hypothetical protein
VDIVTGLLEVLTVVPDVFGSNPAGPKIILKLDAGAPIVDQEKSAEVVVTFATVKLKGVVQALVVLNC